MYLRRSLLCAAAALAFASSVVPAAGGGTMPLSTSSAEAKTLFEKARDMMGNLEAASAIRLCDQAIEIDPSFAMAYVLRGTAAGSRGYLEDVGKAASMIDRVSPGERLWILAEQAVADGKPADARKPFDELVQMFPEDKHVRLRAAAYYMTVALEPAQAMNHLKRATAIDPAFAPAFNLLGYLQSDQGDYKGAEKSFQRYIELQPSRPNPYDSYAELLMKMGRYDASIAQYRKALARDSAFASSLGGVGTNLVLKKDFVAARQAFDQQREKAPDLDAQLDATENIAKSYVAEGKVDRAVESYGRIRDQAEEGRLATRAAWACLDASFVLTEAGKAAEAREWVERAERGLSDSDLPEAIKARFQRGARLAVARIHAAAGEFDEAQAEVEAVRPAIEEARVPGEMRSMNETLGVIALRQQHYSDAVAYLAKADDRSPYVLFQRAKAMAGAGQNAQAATLFRKVAEWNTNDLGYAMVRDEAHEKASTAPVATAGRKR